MIPGLQPSVETALPGIFAKWEGNGLPYPYTDRKGLVTVGTGNLIDPVAMSLVLPWERPDGSPATRAEVANEWLKVKQAFPGVQSTACARLTSLRLPKSALDALNLRTIAAMWARTCAIFPGAQSWPADAQLGVLSIDWAWGAGFPSVWDAIGSEAEDPGYYGYGSKFRELLTDPPNFVEAAAVMRDASGAEEKRNPGIVPRDVGEVVMFHNAQAVMLAGADHGRLWYPAEFAA